jgi:hypothetical protein
MRFSEDDLRSALRRREPGENFSLQVLAKARSMRLPEPAPRSMLTRKLAVAAALVIFVCAATWAGFAQYRRVEQRRAGEAAEQQAILALRITTAELNHVFERVQANTSVQSDSGGKYEEN